MILDRLRKISSLSLSIFKLSPLQYRLINPLSANPTKWSNTLKQFVGKSR